ncbi:branched-chain amino acid transporter [Pseudomonas taeanensis MS-3]|uniref:Branched-chain amino acid transport system carrier protein n=1 Tax=Pseudomonas taeanensis MS-3 TaxID=1395571 RepID=A0A0A1YIX2_9PSED|nr:branched-chain amino acid transport system II carrier protein [Pseudomonas taeanensis]KFX69026.1 branched-chain amino acid transporter [Pseudomonas taeanensis MS-3]
MTRLQGSDLLALGFMTFALFLGAGNIIFPPSAGMAAGEHIGLAALGFLLTGVGLPLLTIVALARVGGGMPLLTAPLGKRAGILFAVAVYLAIGPLFATPRTAVVSFEMGVAPFTGNSGTPLLIYSLAYFAAVMFLSLNPGQLVDRIGKFITPVLLAALLVLGGAALLVPAGEIGQVSADYQATPFVQGFLQGYLTMDTLGALVFGIVIASAIRDRGVTDAGLITRYSVIAGLIAAVGLSLVYLALFYLGATSQGIAGEAQNGVQILTTYVQHTFGIAGSLLLAIVITLACLTTAVGLLTACGEFFSSLLPISYRVVVVIFGCFSLLVANQGLTQLISVSVPVLVGLYPLAIVLVALNLLGGLWLSPRRVFVPVMTVTLIFGLVDGFAAAGFKQLVPRLFSEMPLAAQSLGWLVPVLVTLLLAAALDRVLGRPSPQLA